MRHLNILFLAEGNAESWDAWSGTAKSIVDHLRRAGHTIEIGDVDLYGADRWVAAATTFSPRRHRWGTRFHLGHVPFRLRSRRARHHVVTQSKPIDVILQIGATFQASGHTGVPYCLCCDSNIRMAVRGASSGHSDAAPLSRRELEQIARREQRVYNGAAAIFTLSDYLGRSFVDDFRIPAERVRAIYAGPNLEPPTLPANRRVSSDGNRAPTVLFVGLQFHRKGGDVLLESFRRVKRRLPAARLVFAGLPVGYIQEPGVECLGELHKDRPDEAARLIAAYESADVFALPTRFEPFGIAFVEAMHFGLPCIGPKAWAVPEIIADGETGFTVPPEDVDALTDRLLRLLSDPGLGRSMGEAARQRAQTLFTWPHAVSRMTEVMSVVLPGVNSSGRPALHRAS